MKTIRDFAKFNYASSLVVLNFPLYFLYKILKHTRILTKERNFLRKNIKFRGIFALIFWQRGAQPFILRKNRKNSPASEGSIREPSIIRECFYILETKSSFFWKICYFSLIFREKISCFRKASSIRGPLQCSRPKP